MFIIVHIVGQVMVIVIFKKKYISIFDFKSAFVTKYEMLILKSSWMFTGRANSDKSGHFLPLRWDEIISLLFYLNFYIWYKIDLI